MGGDADVDVDNEAITAETKVAVTSRARLQLYAGLAHQAKRDFGVITRQQLLDAGFDPRAIERMVKSRRLERLHQCVYAFPGSVDSRERRFAAARLWYGCDAALSHYSAARLWGLQDVPDKFAIDVLRIGRFKRPKHYGIKAHETDHLPDSDVVEHKGHRVTTPLRTVVDLARVLTPAKLEIAILDAIARGLFTEDQLIARCHEERRMRTRSAARLTHAIRRAGFKVVTESPLEREVLQVLMDEGLKPEHGQVELYRVGAPKPVGRFDFGSEAARLLIEADSRKFHRALAQRQRDAEKDQGAAELAYAVVRIRKEHLAGEARVQKLNELREQLASAPARIAAAEKCPPSRLVPVSPKKRRSARSAEPARQLALLGGPTKGDSAPRATSRVH